ncbi:fido domain-containing protein, partial [Podospora australis]
ARREVLQHAHALAYFFDRFIEECPPEGLSEELLLSTHKILCAGWEDSFAGKYRDCRVATKFERTECMRAEAIPDYMARMVKDFNEQVDLRWPRSGATTPNVFTVAARYHNQLAMIHPFVDGNGRMSRILLNGILFKYSRADCSSPSQRLVAPIGKDLDEKWEYLDTTTSASKVFRDEDMEVPFAKQTYHEKFAKMVRNKGRGIARLY